MLLELAFCRFWDNKVFLGFFCNSDELDVPWSDTTRGGIWEVSMTESINDALTSSETDNAKKRQVDYNELLLRGRGLRESGALGEWAGFYWLELIQDGIKGNRTFGVEVDERLGVSVNFSLVYSSSRQSIQESGSIKVKGRLGTGKSLSGQNLSVAFFEHDGEVGQSVRCEYMGKSGIQDNTSESVMFRYSNGPRGEDEWKAIMFWHADDNKWVFDSDEEEGLGGEEPDRLLAYWEMAQKVVAIAIFDLKEFFDKKASY